MNGYELSRTFTNFAFDNPEKISPNHYAIYFFAIEHCNRLGWKDKFGFPSQMTMDAIGIKKNQTYTRYFNELVDWGFFKLIQRSSNQYSSNIISLQSAVPKKGEALDKAIIKHGVKQTEGMGSGNGQSNSTIDKQVNHKPETNKPINYSFDDFWNNYNNKVGKEAAQKAWNKLTDNDKAKIKGSVINFIKHKPFKDYTLPHPSTYLNQKRFNDEVKNTVINGEFYEGTNIPKGRLVL